MSRIKRRARREGTHLLRVPYQPTGKSLFIDTHDKGITEEILTLHVKEPVNTTTIQTILRERGITAIIDIGANIGDFVVLEHQAQPNAALYAIEPVERNMAVLRKNIKAHRLEENVTVIHGAVGTQNTEAHILVPEQGNWSSFKESEFTHDAPTESVTMYTLDSLFQTHNIPKEHVLMRMDIEGYELDLFRAHRAFLTQLSDAWVSIEFHTQLMTPDEACELLDIFETAGFSIAHITNDAPYWVSFFHRSFLYPLLVWAYRKRIGTAQIENVEQDVDFDVVKNRIRASEYVYAPHITFYKP